MDRNDAADSMMARLCIGAFLIALMLPFADAAAAESPLRVLLLGDEGHHRPADMAKLLTPILVRDGIQLSYSTNVRDLVPDKLKQFDAVAIFRDSGDLPAANEAALIDFVESGRGLVAIHCASHCFRNSDKYTKLVGGRFLKHGTGVFRARIIDAQHPAMQGFKSFEEWDETYVHNELAADIRVLMARPEAGGLEPSAWVRDQGKGRVFYTALGHDERAWRNPEWQKLIARGIRWSAGKEPARNVNGFEYTEADVPNYMPGAAWGTMAEPIRKMQKPLPAVESMKHIHTPEGFRVELFAADPDMIQGKPIAMAWDHRGRLWISETVDYPNERKPAGQGRDRIVILEDTDGDGRADKRTVFADSLSIPTSFAFADGGIVVTQAPDTLFLMDTDGDGKADVRKVLFTGWGTQDTHAGPSNLRWGLDNWLWGTVGYSGFDGTVGGKRHRFGQGIWRMKPDGSTLEFIASTTNNTWGLGIDAAGNVFASTANGMHSVQLGLPNRVYERVRGWFGPGAVGIADHTRIHPITPNVRQVDYFGGFTAAAGHAVYTGGAFPQDYENVAFVCEPTGHVVHINRLVKRGTSFTSRDGFNLFASDDEWTAPIMAEVGPDGAVWVVDWYNFIVQHNPTPPGFKTGRGNAYETPLRDKSHGRIYRVVHENAIRQVGPPLDAATPSGLIAALKHDNLWQRQTAQRLLVERGNTDVVPALRDLVVDPVTGVAGLHALRILQALNQIDETTLKAGLMHLHTPTRRAACEVQPRDASSVERMLAAKSLADDDAHVRMAALLALAEMPASDGAARAIAEALGVARNMSDQWIVRAAIAAGAANGVAFLDAASTAAESPALRDVLKQVAIHVARGSPTTDADRLLRIIASANPQVVEPLLSGLSAGWPESATVTLDAANEKVLLALPEKLEPAALQPFLALARRWGQGDKLAKFAELARRGLLARLGDEKLADAIRATAAKELIQQLDDAASAAAVIGQLNAKTSPALAAGLFDALALSSAADVAPLLIKSWGGLTPAVQTRATALLLRRPAWTRALVAALEDGTVSAAELSIEHTQRLARHSDAGIAGRTAKVLARGGRLPDADRQKLLDELLPLAKKSGDAVRGKVVFEENCAKCHKLGSLGSTVGPDLTGIAARPRAEILTEILDPNRSVEGNYRQYQVLTRKGVTMTGLLAAETQTAIELLDSEGKRQVLLRDDIESLDATKLSLMPEGFEKLPAADLVSLLDFLSARERFSPLPLAKAATIVSTRGMFTDPANNLERLIFEKWGPQVFAGVPFQVIDPRDGAVPNVILLQGRQGAVSRTMPKSVSVPCNAPAKAVHLLSGVGGWCHPFGRTGSVSMIVRLHYADGQTEDHPLKNGEHMADYIRVVDVPGSKLAFRLRGQQVRYLSIAPNRKDSIATIEFVKGDDDTAPVVMAVTIEGFN